jgi:hypothetical protein
MIIYYSECEEVGGSTALVARQGADDEAFQWPLIKQPGYNGIPFINDRYICEEWMKENEPDMFKFREKLYERERPVKYNKGTVLLYRHDVWHRGTPVLPGKYRIIQNLVYKRKECEWLTNWNYGWARMNYNTGKNCSDFVMEKIIGKLNYIQRCVLSFPPPGHSYWNETTINAVYSRYKFFGFDKTIYEQKMIKQK